MNSVYIHTCANGQTAYMRLSEWKQKMEYPNFPTVTGVVDVWPPSDILPQGAQTLHYAMDSQLSLAPMRHSCVGARNELHFF